MDEVANGVKFDSGPIITRETVWRQTFCRPQRNSLDAAVADDVIPPLPDELRLSLRKSVFQDPICPRCVSKVHDHRLLGRTRAVVCGGDI